MFVSSRVSIKQKNITLENCKIRKLEKKRRQTWIKELRVKSGGVKSDDVRGREASITDFIYLIKSKESQK